MISLEYGEEKRATCEKMQWEMLIKHLPRAYPSQLTCCRNCLVGNCMIDSAVIYEAYNRDKRMMCNYEDKT